jgi:putative NADH-flavin reductase
MRIAVFGATGRTGRLVVDEALARGHAVVAIARHPPAEHASRPGLRWAAADVLDPDAVARAVAGCEAVIVALGPGSVDDARTCGEGTRHIVAAARAAGVTRLAAVTGAIIGHPEERLGVVLRAIRRRFLGTALAVDRAAQEAAVRESGLAWTIVRPTRLVDGPAGAALIGEDVLVPSLGVSRRADVARALVDGVTGGVTASAGRGRAVALVSAAPARGGALATWVGAYAAGELLGLGAVAALGALVFGAAGPPGVAAIIALALAAGLVEGVIAGTAQGLALGRLRPALRLRRWVGATVLGALAGWLLGSLPSILLGGGDGEAASAAEPSRALALVAAAGLGAVAGPILAAFQALVLRPHLRRTWPWLVASAVGWAAGMPLVFLAVDVGWAGSLAAALALLAAAGACAGAATAVALRRELRAAA